MAQHITITEFEQADFTQLLQMGRKLWSKFDKDDLEQLLKQAATLQKYHILMAKSRENAGVGFSIFSIRTDYVEGAFTSPTGYLEGIFVEPDFRKSGIAKEFLRLGEAWCKSRGCTQLGSDTWLTHTQSREFHKRLGFWEQEEIVHFLKDID